ncbi:MAG: hypothetical protein KGI54_08195 [Pseudomonadota bacterium]|nr:hypothetical protein [Pseudomonadota bacterium]
MQFIEFSSEVNKALERKGFIKENSATMADVVIFLGYGISLPHTQQTTTELPVWGQTGIASASTYGTLNTYGNLGSYSSTTTYSPTYGITGYSPLILSRTIYTRFVSLDALDVKAFLATKKPVQDWVTTVRSRGEIADLRYIFPYLVAEMEQYLGTNTGRAVKVIIHQDDKTAVQLKMPSAPSY